MKRSIPETQKQQITGLIRKFKTRFGGGLNAGPEEWGDLCKNMRNSHQGGMKPHQLEELIAEEGYLPLDYFRGLDGDNGIRIKDIEAGRVDKEELLQVEDLAPVAYAIACVLASEAIAAQLPDFDQVQKRHQFCKQFGPFQDAAAQQEAWDEYSAKNTRRDFANYGTHSFQKVQDRDDVASGY